MSIRMRRIFALVIVLLILPTLVSAQDSPIAPVELRVMTFNIWLGGEGEDFSKVIEAIQSADANIVGLQEATGNAPALRWDWVGIYAADNFDLYSGYLGFIYTQATVSDSITFDADALGEEMLPAGDYVVRLMKDDGYEVLASAEFSIGE